MMIDANAAVTLLEKKPEKNSQALNVQSRKRFSFASIINSTFNCYYWTSITTLYSIKIQCRTSPTAEEQNLHNSLLDSENSDYISDTDPTGNLTLISNLAQSLKSFLHRA